jgi:hypothetical protein
VVRRALLALPIVAALTACATLSFDAGEPSPTSTITPTSTPTPTASPTPTPVGIFFRTGQHASGTTAQKSVSATFPAPVSAGGLVTVAISAGQGAVITSVKDEKSEVFTEADMAATPAGAQLWIYYAKVVDAGAKTVTVTFQQNTNAVLQIAEFAGTDPQNPVAGVVHANGSSATPTSGSITPDVPAHLDFVAALADAAPVTITPGTGYSGLDQGSTPLSGPLADEYQIAGGTMTQAVGTFDYSSTETWACSLVVFR